MQKKKLTGRSNGSMLLNVSLVLLFAGLCLAIISSTANMISKSAPDGPFTISQNGSFTESEANERGLADKVIMIKSKYCKQCSATLPDFEKASEEMGIAPIILEVTDSSDQKELGRYKVQAQYVPTFIIGGSYYVGPRSVEEYRTMLDYFLRG